MKIYLPDYVKFILDRLITNGYKAYIVGGCVRDSIMGKEPNDWDIATDAKPYEIMNIFKDLYVIPTGIKHGTVTVLIDSQNIEVTTFRIEGKYSDFRRPDAVNYTNSLQHDLSRRDFTVNSVAYDEKEGIIDLYGGLQDIENKIIRCVGDPDKRFREDALRMLRAVRFSCQLGFLIERSTLEAICANSHLIKYVSFERIRDEINKIILSDHLESIIYLLSTNLLKHILKDKSGLKLNRNSFKEDDLLLMIRILKNSEKKLTIRIPIIFMISVKNSKIPIETIECLLKMFKYDKRTISEVKKLLQYKDIEFFNDREFIIKCIGKLGIEGFRALLKIKEAFLKADSSVENSYELKKLSDAKHMFEDAIEKGECFSLKQLSINGDDLLMLGYPPGKQIGRILNELLNVVIKYPEMNTKEKLINYLKLKDYPKI